MRDTIILDVMQALPEAETTHLPSTPLHLRLLSGDCALIEIRDPVRASEFADLCCGLLPLRQGQVRFLGRDWATMPDEQAAALRGRIGRVFGIGAWVGFLNMDLNILLPQLHHTRRPAETLHEAAAEVARVFGLPGLPLVRPEALSSADLARAACVRAFLGTPQLLLLESPVQSQFTDLVSPLLNALAAARDRGAAAIWLTRSDFVWSDRSFPATHRLRLTESGLVSHRQAA